MKINKTISAMGCVLGLAAASQADNTVYITGSTAFRAQIFNALTDMGLGVQGGATSGNNIFTFTGTISAHLPSPSNNVALATGGDSSVTVYCSFTGSSEAINSLGNKVSPTYTNYAGASPVAVSYPNGGDLGMCDVAETSTPYPTPAVNEIIPPDAAASSYGAGVAIVPFTWACSVDASGKIQNVTPYIVNDAYANGTEALSYFTGNPSDANTFVYAVGRTNDSGTRITGLLDVGYNTQDTVVQWALGTAGVCPGVGPNSGTIQAGLTYQNVANDGYVSGGSVVKALNVAGTGDAIGYLGWPDANSLKNGAVPVLYQGENPTTLSAAPTAGTWTGGTTTWNIAGVANGSYTYWSYEHMYESTAVASGSFVDEFGHDLAEALEFEIIQFTAHGTGIQTALTVGEMNVHRNADGGDVLTGN